MKRLIEFFLPDTRSVSLREKALSAFLAFIVTLLCIYVAGFLIDVSKEPVYIASLGAAAVLLFAAPKSPFSQPWPFFGSHIISSFIGVFCFQNIPIFALSIAVAVGLAIFAMYVLRCLHPPGGAAALAVILGSSDVQQLGYGYILSPVLINVVLLFLFALLVNNLVPGRSYPNRPATETKPNENMMGLGSSLYNQSDLESALTEMDSYIDISREDLNRIYRLAVSHANQRRIGNVPCKEVMTKNLLTFEYATELEEAWKILHEKNLKAAPVVDPFNRVIGIVTIRDFVKFANHETETDLIERMKHFISRTEGQTSEKKEVVGQIMSAPAITVEQGQHIVNLLDVFSNHNIHHMPIIDNKKHLVGMITRTDLMRALQVLRT